MDLKIKISILFVCFSILFISIGCHKKDFSNINEEKSESRKCIMLTYSWSFKNIGSTGITNGVMELINKYIPETDVIIIANEYSKELDEYFTKRYPNIIDIIPNPFELSMESISRDNFKDIQMPPQAKPFLGLPNEDAAIKFQKALERTDFILYNSGTMMSYGRWGFDANRLMCYSWPLIIADKYKKKYGVYCNSFERFAWPSNELMVPILSNAEFIFFRDGNSLEYLKNLGVKSPIMEFGPDATFAFYEQDSLSGRNLMDEFDLIDNKFITITIRSGLQGFVGAGSDRESEHAATIIELINRYVSETDNQVLICPEFAGEIEPSRQLIYNQLGDNEVKKKVKFLEEFWAPEVANYVYSKAECIVTMEGHSVIMGLAMGTPVLHPRFLEAGRKAWMLKDLGLEDWLFDIDEVSVDDIYDELKKIHEDFGSAKAKVLKANEYIQLRQKESMAVLKNALNE